MNECICICMHECMYVHMYICVYLGMYVWGELEYISSMDFLFKCKLGKGVGQFGVRVLGDRGSQQRES